MVEGDGGEADGALSDRSGSSRAESERGAGRRTGAKVRKTPSWSRSWINFSLFLAVFAQECVGQLASFGPT